MQPRSKTARRIYTRPDTGPALLPPAIIPPPPTDSTRSRNCGRFYLEEISATGPRGETFASDPGYRAAKLEADVEGPRTYSHRGAIGDRGSRDGNVREINAQCCKRGDTPIEEQIEREDPCAADDGSFEGYLSDEAPAPGTRSAASQMTIVRWCSQVSYTRMVSCAWRPDILTRIAFEGVFFNLIVDRLHNYLSCTARARVVKHRKV